MELTWGKFKVIKEKQSKLYSQVEITAGLDSLNYLLSTIRCSICVNGVCLTATELKDDTFKVGLAPETLRRTYLGDLESGEHVNLERASEIGGRNSGHFVQGHVDGVGTIIDRWIDEDSLFFKVKVGADSLRYIVPKGYIAVDGTSLTVCEVNYKQKY